MKYSLIFITIFFINTAFAEDIVLVIKNGITYDFNTDTPFSGTSLSSWYNSAPKEFITYQNGVRNGPYETYYQNGQIEVQTNYLNGELHGLYEKYFSNGQIEIQTNYQNGKYQGSYLEYSSDGSLVKRTNFEDGEYHRSYFEYYQNGQMR